MRNRVRFRKTIFAVLAFAMLFSLLYACRSEEEPVNPYEGMVQVADGRGGLMWVNLEENLPVNDMVCSGLLHIQRRCFLCRR
jgi:hypothetical protein